MWVYQNLYILAIYLYTTSLILYNNFYFNIPIKKVTIHYKNWLSYTLTWFKHISKAISRYCEPNTASLSQITMLGPVKYKYLIKSTITYIYMYVEGQNNFIKSWVLGLLKRKHILINRYKILRVQFLFLVAK